MSTGESERVSSRERDSSHERSSPRESSSGMSIQERLRKVSPGLILKHIAKKRCYNSDASNTYFSIADVSLILDFAKDRPQYFIEAVKVINPMVDTPEES